jgi:dodecin
VLRVYVEATPRCGSRIGASPARASVVLLIADRGPRPVRQGIAKASETVRNIKGAWVSQQTVEVEGGTIVEHRTDLKVSFVLD